jgi:hypothetical protein
MKYLHVLLCAAAISFAWIDENGADSSIPAGTPPAGGDAISLTLLNTITVPSASHILGLNMQYGSNQFGMVDNTSDLLRGINCETGAEAWTIPISYGSSPSNFGTAHDWPPPYGWYLNAWTDSDMHYYDGSDWSVAFANPVGILGRGMEYDPTSGYLWESYTNGTTYLLYRISSSGAYTSYPVASSGQISGVAAFYDSGDPWVVFTSYYDPSFYFYEFTGSALTFMGSAATGVSVSASLGLTYSDARDTFFWSYQDDSGYHVAELAYSLSALEQDTWGAIKAQF